MKSRGTNPSISNDDSLNLSSTNPVVVKISGTDSEKQDSSKAIHTVSYFDNIDKSWKLLFCFVGLQLSYVTWGVFQEKLMTQEYKMGRFRISEAYEGGSLLFLRPIVHFE